MEAFLKNFDLDTTDVPMILFGALFFFIFSKLFAKYFIEPFHQIVRAREQATSGSESNAQTLREQATELEQQYAKKMSEARTVAVQQKLEALALVRNESDALIDKTQENAQAALSKSRQENAQRIAQLRNAMNAESGPLADTITQKVKALLSSGAKATSSIRSNQALLFGFAILAGMLCGDSAFAEEAEHSGHHLLSLGQYLDSIKLFRINFLIFAGGMYFLTRKPVSLGFKERSLGVAKSVQASKKLYEDAKLALSNAQSKLARLTQDIATMQHQIEEETKLESAKIREEGTHRAQQIERQSRDLAAMEKLAGEKSVENELLVTALALAKQKLRAETSPEADRIMRSSAVNSIAGLMIQ